MDYEYIYFRNQFLQKYVFASENQYKQDVYFGSVYSRCNLILSKSGSDRRKCINFFDVVGIYCCASYMKYFALV